MKWSIHPGPYRAGVGGGTNGILPPSHRYREGTVIGIDGIGMVLGDRYREYVIGIKR